MLYAFWLVIWWGILYRYRRAQRFAATQPCQPR
jgi:hypothetical protein